MRTVRWWIGLILMIDGALSLLVGLARAHSLLDWWVVAISALQVIGGYYTMPESDRMRLRFKRPSRRSPDRSKSE